MRVAELGGKDAYRHANISDAKRFNKGDADARIAARNPRSRDRAIM
jgi:hypothetical protein